MLGTNWTRGYETPVRRAAGHPELPVSALLAANSRSSNPSLSLIGVTLVANSGLTTRHLDDGRGAHIDGLEQRGPRTISR